MKIIFPHCPDVVGIDQPSAIDVCKKRYGNGEFFADNFETPVLKLDKKFDLIICCDVIEHLMDPDILLNYIKRFSHNDSLIVFSTPERDLLRGPDCMVSEKPEHVREWNHKEFLKYLKSRGFVIEEALFVPTMKFNLSREYILYLKRVLKGIHAFNTCQVAVTRLSKGA
jgi:2-polyprenyl-3-methyl-5-hydroxy-6-metoxy-1,4-benzoquinol methylase